MRTLAVAAVAVLIASPALAQRAPAMRVEGTIASFAPQTHMLEVKTAKGMDTVSLPDNANVIVAHKATLDDIKAGDFVASAGMTEPDGKIHAQEVRIFPKSMMGVGEGQYPMNLPHQSMTNATVEQINGASVAAGTGMLKLSFHGSGKDASGACTGHATAPGKGTCTGQTEIVVGPDIPVTKWMQGDTAMLMPGKMVSVLAAKGADGKLSARAVIIDASKP